jgi:hypothetical protein
VRDGVAHLRVEGEAARAVEARAAELGRALAGEGLRLGELEVRPPSDRGGALADHRHRGHDPRGGRQGSEDPQPRAAPPPPPSPKPGGASRGVRA